MPNNDSVRRVAGRRRRRFGARWVGGDDGSARAQSDWLFVVWVVVFFLIAVTPVLRQNNIMHRLVALCQQYRKPRRAARERSYHARVRGRSPTPP